VRLRQQMRRAWNGIDPEVGSVWRPIQAAAALLIAVIAVSWIAGAGAQPSPAFTVNPPGDLIIRGRIRADALPGSGALASRLN
jgi:hypothetical protein